MREIVRQLFILIIVTSFVVEIEAQQNSREELYDRLFYTCKVWGHAKYYHSKVAGGFVDWDDALIEAYPLIKNAPNQDAFNDILHDMLQSAGESIISGPAPPPLIDSLYNNGDLSWIDDGFLSEEVAAELHLITDRFRPKSNVYIDAGNTSNPKFNNDSKYYNDQSYPSEEFRFLAICRYWNIINLFFPYKYIMDEPWDNVLETYIAPIMEAEDAITYHIAFKEFTAQINDSHSFYSSTVYSGLIGSYSPPFIARFIEDEFVITQVIPSEEQVKVGDIILSIDGQTILELVDSFAVFMHGSNPPTIDRNIGNAILRGPFGNFSITVNDGQTTETHTLKRNLSNSNILAEEAPPLWRDTILPSGCHYGLVHMDHLEPDQVEAMFDDLWVY